MAHSRKRMIEHDFENLTDEIDANLNVLSERSMRIKEIVSRRKKSGIYNITDLQKILKKLHSAKRNVADIEFI